MKQIIYFRKMTGRSWGLLLLVWLISQQSCIIHITNRKADDGSTTLSKSDSEAIKPFSPTDRYKTKTIVSPEFITFQTIDAENVNELVKQQYYTWILIGASWCPISSKAYIKANEIIRKFPSDSIRLVIINQDFNIRLFQNELFKAGYFDCPYLLSPVEYGRDEAYKQEKFAKDLRWNLPIGPFKGGGVPMNIIVNKYKRGIHLFGGVKFNADSIEKFTGLVMIH